MAAIAPSPLHPSQLRSLPISPSVLLRHVFACALPCAACARVRRMCVLHVLPHALLTGNRGDQLGRDRHRLSVGDQRGDVAEHLILQLRRAPRAQISQPLRYT